MYRMVSTSIGLCCGLLPLLTIFAAARVGLTPAPGPCTAFTSRVQRCCWEQRCMLLRDDAIRTALLCCRICAVCVTCEPETNARWRKAVRLRVTTLYSWSSYKAYSYALSQHAR